MFVKVAEVGSFVAASRALGMPRSTVSRRIAALEDELGCRLFERTTRHVRITEEGRRLSEGASPLLRGISVLLDEVVSGEDSPEGRVRVATPVGLGRRFVSAFFRGIHDELPGIRAEVIVSDRRVDLVRDDLDMALVEGDLEDCPWIAKRVLTTDVMCVASPGYLEEHGTPKDPSELNDHRTLHRLRGGERVIRWPLKDGGTQPLRPSISTTDVDLLRQAAVDGVGIAFLSQAVVFAELAEGTLAPLLPMVTERRPYHILYQQRHPPRRVRAVMDFAFRFIAEAYAGVPTPPTKRRRSKK